MTNWVAAEAVARAQFGLITRAQVLEAGLANASIYRAIRQGRLAVVHSGVYRFTAVETSWEQRALLPQLIQPGRLALSHTTAAWLYGLSGIRRPKRLSANVMRDVELTVDDLEVHHVRFFSAPRRVGVFDVTSVGRTLLDLASVVDRETLTFAFDAATQKYPREMTALFEYSSENELRGHSGAAVLREVFAERHGVPLDSPLESRVWTALLRSKLPLPAPQASVHGVMRADFVWGAERVIAHVDSRAFHSSRAEIDRDARQRNELAGEWTTFIITSGTLQNDDWLGLIGEALRRRAPQRRLPL